MSKFAKATKKVTRARIALMGPSGSGKTKTALLMASGLGKRIAVIDTENASASKYAGDDGVDFDVLALESFSPERYVEAIHDAEAEGYDVLIIDSLSHAWSGKDGALEMVDRAAKRSQSGNSFTAWRDITPLHNRLVDALVRCKCHLIVTMRTKTEYVLEEVTRGGKTSKQPRRVGLAPVQRDGMEYEFDIVADMTPEHDFVVSKSRCTLLDGAVISKPNAGLGTTILNWLSDGEAQSAPIVEHEKQAFGTATGSMRDQIEQEFQRRVANQIRRQDESEPLRGMDGPFVPMIEGKKHPKAGQPIDVLNDEEVVNYIRAMMHVAESPKWAKEMAPKIAAAKAWAARERGMKDSAFSQSKADRSEQLKAAVNQKSDSRVEYDPELYTVVVTYPVETFGENDIRTWTNPEKLIEYSTWLREQFKQPSRDARIQLVEARLEQLMKEEAERAEAALSKTA